MARPAKPWFNRQRNCWMVWFNGKREKLAEGRSSKKAAQDPLVELQFEASRNPHPDAGPPTIASIIERYQTFAEKWLAASTQATRPPYLQSFAEAHGWRPFCARSRFRARLHDISETPLLFRRSLPLRIVVRKFLAMLQLA